jgi:hypothetical protein
LLCIADMAVTSITKGQSLINGEATFDGVFLRFPNPDRPVASATDWAHPSLDGECTGTCFSMKVTITEAMRLSLQQLNKDDNVDVYGHVQVATPGAPSESSINLLHQLAELAVLECDHQHIMLAGISKKNKALALAAASVVSTAVTLFCKVAGELQRAAALALLPVGVVLNLGGNDCGTMPPATDDGMDTDFHQLANAIVAKLTTEDEVIERDTFYNHNRKPKGGIVGAVVRLCSTAQYDPLVEFPPTISLTSYHLWIRASSHQFVLMTRCSLQVRRPCVYVWVCVGLCGCGWGCRWVFVLSRVRPRTIICTHH